MITNYINKNFDLGFLNIKSNFRKIRYKKFSHKNIFINMQLL